MKSHCFLLTLFAVVFAPGLLHAQQSDPNVKTEPWGLKAQVTLIDFLAVRNEKMYEDIEIMRRILDRKLTTLYLSEASASTGAAWILPAYGPTDVSQVYRGALAPTQVNNGTYLSLSAPLIQDKEVVPLVTNAPLLRNNYQGYLNSATDVTTSADIPRRSLEGFYLKGQGIIYTATLSSLQPSAKAQADSSDKVEVVDIVLRESEWDSIRRQVRNEKEKPKKPENSKPPSLSDVLLKVLADNGHHFSQLGENESLTIVLTVHEASSSSTAAKSGTGSAKTESKPAEGGSDADASREVRNFEMLGELYLKQAKYHEALIVFQRWLERTESPKQKAELRRKLAQCYLSMGEDEKARAELDQAIALMKKETEAKEKPAAKPAAALPVKLIISAPKKLLDQVKAGKISFEEFRRQASVETLRFGDRR